MTVLYPNLCYNDVCYKGTVLYIFVQNITFWDITIYCLSE